MAVMRLGIVLLLAGTSASAAEPLSVVSDFEGASVRDLEILQEARSIRFMPGGDPVRGWPCWWFFQVNGVTPGETITLRLRGSDAVRPNPNGPAAKPLSAVWAMPAQATFSIDGKNWKHTGKGMKDGDEMVYQVTPDARTAWVAWGPPYTVSDAADRVRLLSEKSPHAKSEVLCKSRGGRPVPMLRIREGKRTDTERFGIWVQARQHAWESGSSWVAQGFAEWVLGETPEAGWLRQHADIFLVPVMDVDNVATGNGGKDATPHDHNRDWSPQPHWNEIIAAQRKVTDLIEEGRMDVFLDLHNPAPGDPTFFYILKPELLREPMIGLRNRFIDLAYQRISKIKPLIPMSNKPKVTGEQYSPQWRQISANWVSLNGNAHTVSLCLETIWNYENSTTEGYRAVGANLAAATREFLAERPAR